MVNLVANDKIIKFMFWGRLTQEKWFDLIIKRIEKYKWSQNINNIYIDIFGDGKYGEELVSMIWINKLQSIDITDGKKKI